MLWHFHKAQLDVSQIKTLNCILPGIITSVFFSCFHFGTGQIHNVLFKTIALHLNTLHLQLKSADSHIILVIHLVNSRG